LNYINKYIKFDVLDTGTTRSKIGTNKKTSPNAKRHRDEFSSHKTSPHETSPVS
jgi:hypothetical protein